MTGQTHAKALDIYPLAPTNSNIAILTPDTIGPRRGSIGRRRPLAVGTTSETNISTAFFDGARARDLSVLASICTSLRKTRDFCGPPVPSGHGDDFCALASLPRLAEKLSLLPCDIR